MGTFEQDKYAAHRAAVHRARYELNTAGHHFPIADVRALQLILELCDEHPAMAWRKTSAQGAIDALRNGREVRDADGFRYYMTPGIEFKCVGVPDEHPGKPESVHPRRIAAALHRLLAGLDTWQVPA